MEAYSGEGVQRSRWGVNSNTVTLRLGLHQKS